MLKYTVLEQILPDACPLSISD